MEGCTALQCLSGRRLRIYFGTGSSIDCFARAREGCERYRKIGRAARRDRDRRTAPGHGIGNHL